MPLCKGTLPRKSCLIRRVLPYRKTDWRKFRVIANRTQWVCVSGKMLIHGDERNTITSVLSGDDIVELFMLSSSTNMMAEKIISSMYGRPMEYLHGNGTLMFLHPSYNTKKAMRDLPLHEIKFALYSVPLYHGHYFNNIMHATILWEK